MKRIILILSVFLSATLMLQSAPEIGSAFQVDSSGIALNSQSGSFKPTDQSAADISILVFIPFLDVSTRLSNLGYTVTETTNPADLNRLNLQNYNVLWISVTVDPSSYASQNSEIQTWVNSDGGGLIINQPDQLGNVTVFPPGFEVIISDIYWPGDFGATIVDYNHPITQGLVDDDLSGNFETVTDTDIGSSWNILAVDAETPIHVSLLAGEYGKGKLVFNTNNFATAAVDSGSDKYLVQMTDWAGSGKSTWGRAYEFLFDDSSDLDLLREYRDEVLTQTAKGRRYKEKLYRYSEKALAVLNENPALMVQAKALIDANKEAVWDVINGDEGYIYNTQEIATFLDAYAKKAPPGLELLAKMVKRHMLNNKRKGKLFFGFRLK
jgi:hypothetical protein